MKLLPKLVGFFPGDVSGIFELPYLAFTRAQVIEMGQIAPPPRVSSLDAVVIKFAFKHRVRIEIIRIYREKIIVNGEVHYRAIKVGKIRLQAEEWIPGKCLMYINADVY